MLVMLITVDQAPQEVEISDYVDEHAQWDTMCDYINARYVGWTWLPKDQVMLYDEEAVLKDLDANKHASKLAKRAVWGPVIVTAKSFLRQNT